MCKEWIHRINPIVVCFLPDKGDKAGAHPYNRILARA